MPKANSDVIAMETTLPIYGCWYLGSLFEIKAAKGGATHAPINAPKIMELRLPPKTKTETGATEEIGIYVGYHPYFSHLLFHKMTAVNAANI